MNHKLINKISNELDEKLVLLKSYEDLKVKNQNSTRVLELKEEILKLETLLDKLMEE